MTGKRAPEVMLASGATPRVGDRRILDARSRLVDVPRAEHNTHVRWLAPMLLAAAVFALPASAASVDPRVFVLRQIDVPARYFLDKENSMALSNALLGSNEEARRVVARSGLVNGYVASYLNSDPPRWRYVTSVAFLFRRAEGARIYLAWLDKSIRERSPSGVRRSPVDLGDAGWTYVSRSRQTGTQVAWRLGRVVALVGCQQMIRHRTLALALARKQQRRIAAALR